MGLDNPLHILFIVLILLLVFGARRIPEIGRSLGTGMREFKQSITGEEHHPAPSAPTLAQGTPQAPAQPVTASAAEPAPTAPAAAAAPAPAPATAPGSAVHEDADADAAQPHAAPQR